MMRRVACVTFAARNTAGSGEFNLGDRDHPGMILPPKPKGGQNPGAKNRKAVQPTALERLF